MAGCGVEHRSQRLCAKRLGADVDRQVEVLRQVLEPGQSSGHRLHLQLDTEADPVGLEEPRLRGPLWIGREASQCLDADDASRVQRHDGLVQDGGLVALQALLDACQRHQVSLRAVTFQLQVLSDQARHEPEDVELGLAEGRPGVPAEAAKGPVDPPVGKDDRSAQVGADAQFLGQTHVAHVRRRGGVGDDPGDAAGDHLLAVRILQRVGATDENPLLAPRLADVGEDALAAPELAYAGDVHVQVLPGDTKQLVDAVARQIPVTYRRRHHCTVTAEARLSGHIALSHDRTRRCRRLPRRQ